MTDDLLERIDALAADEKCPHCDRQWHELPLTRDVAAMFDMGRLDSSSFLHADQSPIVCDGSRFIGPRRPPTTFSYTGQWSAMGTVLEWPKFDAFDAITAAWQNLHTQMTQVLLGVKLTAPWFIPFPEAEPELPCADIPGDVPIEFGPQNWLPPQEPINPPAELTKAVMARAAKFTEPPKPKPGRSLDDFIADVKSQFEEQYPTKYPSGKAPK